MSPVRPSRATWLLVAVLLSRPAIVPAAESSSPSIRLGGYLQIDDRHSYVHFPADSVRHDVGIRRARLSVSGKVHERVTFNVVLQGDRPGAANPVSIIDASADVRLTDAAKLRAGQFKYDFDIEGHEGDDRNPIMDRAFATNAVAGSLTGTSTVSSPAAAFRDRGFELIGERTARDVTGAIALGLFQGNGRAPDNNNLPGYTAQVRVTTRGAMVNLGYMHATAPSFVTVGDSTFKGPDVDYDAWTAGIDHVWRWNHLRAEVHQGDHTTRFGGGYVLDVVRVRPDFDVHARWQVFGGEVDDASLRAFDAGARWYFMTGGERGNTYVEVGYMTRAADDPYHHGLTSLNDGTGVPISSPEEVGDVLMARLQVGF